MGAISVVVDPGPLRYKLSDYQRVNDYLTRAYGEYYVRACPVAANQYDIMIWRLTSSNLWMRPNRERAIVEDVKKMLEAGAD